MTKDQREIHRKLRILQYAEETGHVAKTCRYLGSADPAFTGGGKTPYEALREKL